jgi:hypothetical protein
MNEMKNLLISFSGGRTSAFMCKFILEHSAYKDFNKLFVFANTGKENETTLKFADQCDKHFNLDLTWIEAQVPKEKGIGTKYKIVNYETASRNGEPFEDVIKKFGLPSKLYRHCTRDLKEIPIHKYAKDIFQDKYLTAIGIRADEKHRVGNKDGFIYPLAEYGVDEKLIRNWWDAQPFDLQLKDYQGNCDLCFLKSFRKKLTIINENKNVAKWWQEMEDKYGKDHQDKFDYIKDISVKELIERSKQPFHKAIDKQELNKKQISMFDPQMDIEFDCFCKNT